MRKLTATTFGLGFLAFVTLGAVAGCAGTAQTSRTGFDVLVAHDTTGRKVVVVPATGIMLRDGSKVSQDVEVEWTPSQMKVYSADKSQLLATIDASDIQIQHRGQGATKDDPMSTFKDDDR